MEHPHITLVAVVVEQVGMVVLEQVVLVVVDPLIHIGHQSDKLHLDSQELMVWVVVVLVHLPIHQALEVTLELVVMEWLLSDMLLTQH
jgi:hypothetical protein